jgi:hypothetical protein
MRKSWRYRHLIFGVVFRTTFRRRATTAVPSSTGLSQAGSVVEVAGRARVRRRVKAVGRKDPLSLWSAKAFTRYLDESRLCMSNNLAERAVCCGWQAGLRRRRRKSILTPVSLVSSHVQRILQALARHQIDATYVKAHLVRTTEVSRAAPSQLSSSIRLPDNGSRASTSETWVP